MKPLLHLALLALVACGDSVEPTNPLPPAASSATGSSGSTPNAPNEASTGMPRTATGWAKGACGCSDFTVVVSHASKRRFLVLRSSRKAVGIAAVGDASTITVGNTSGLDVHVDTYDGTGGDALYCTDFGPAAPTKVATLAATTGKVTFRMTAFRSEQDFELSVSLQGVSVRAPDGSLEIIEDATFSDVHVGWLPG